MLQISKLGLDFLFRVSKAPFVVHSTRVIAGLIIDNVSKHHGNRTKIFKAEIEFKTATHVSKVTERMKDTLEAESLMRRSISAFKYAADADGEGSTFLTEVSAGSKRGKPKPDPKLEFTSWLQDLDRSTNAKGLPTMHSSLMSASGSSHGLRRTRTAPVGSRIELAKLSQSFMTPLCKLTKLAEPNKKRVRSSHRGVEAGADGSAARSLSTLGMSKHQIHKVQKKAQAQEKAAGRIERWHANTKEIAYINRSHKQPHGNGIEPRMGLSVEKTMLENGVDLTPEGSLLETCSFPKIEGSEFADGLFATYTLPSSEDTTVAGGRKKKKSPVHVHYYIRKVLHERVQEVEQAWEAPPPEPLEIFLPYLERPDLHLTGWPMPQPPAALENPDDNSVHTPDARQAAAPYPPKAYTPGARAGMKAPEPNKYEHFPPDMLHLNVIAEEAEPEPEVVEEVEEVQTRTKPPELQDVDGDGIPDEMVDVDGDGDFENIATILVGAPIVLDTLTKNATIFYSVDGATPRLPNEKELADYGCTDVIEFFVKAAHDRGILGAADSEIDWAGTGDWAGNAGSETTTVQDRSNAYELGGEGGEGKSGNVRSTMAAKGGNNGDSNGHSNGEGGGGGGGGGGDEFADSGDGGTKGGGGAVSQLSRFDDDFDDGYNKKNTSGEGGGETKPGIQEDASKPGIQEDASKPGIQEDASKPGVQEDASKPGVQEDASKPGIPSGGKTRFGGKGERRGYTEEQLAAAEQAEKDQTEKEKVGSAARKPKQTKTSNSRTDSLVGQLGGKPKGPMFGPIGSPWEHVILYTGPIESDETGATSGLPVGVTTIKSVALRDGMLESEPAECVISVVSGWSLPKSIWAPRPGLADSKDFYDTPRVLKRAFNLDWGRCIKKPSFTKWLGKVRRCSLCCL
jgi:hypothetical protein